MTEHSHFYRQSMMQALRTNQPPTVGLLKKVYMRKKQYHRKPKLAKHVCPRCGQVWKDFSIRSRNCPSCGIAFATFVGDDRKELSLEGKCSAAFFETWLLIIGIGVAILLVMSAVWINKAHADTSIKSGITVPMSKNTSIAYELAVQQEYKGITAEMGVSSLRLKGEEFLGTDSMGRGIYGNNVYRGNLTHLRLNLGYVWHIGRWSINPSFGVGHGLWNANYPCHEGYTNGEYYTGKPQIDTTYNGRFAIGYSVTKHFGLEVGYQWCDLDIDSGTWQVGVAEDSSNLNGIFIMVVWKV